MSLTPLQSFDRFAVEYDRYTDLENPKMLTWLTTHLPSSGRRALDAGCGSGRYSLALAERFESVVAIDISGVLIDIARRRRSHPRVRYEACDLMTFADSSGFDLVFTTATLHHLEDLNAALRLLHGLVNPGGVAMLIDNVASRPTPPRSVNVLGAFRELPGDARRVGWNGARALFKFRTSSAWLDHLASDRYLSVEAFERRYGAVFPGGVFYSLGHAHALSWHKSS